MDNYFSEIAYKYKVYGPLKFFDFCVSEIKYRLINNFLLGSYSQGKEDLVIEKILKKKPKGIYVDVGANDPNHFNNTKRFYEKGWQGINIEPNENYFAKLKNVRRRDTNLNFGIGNTSQPLLFYKFAPSTLSTFSQKQAQEYIKTYKFLGKNKIGIKKLSEVFKQHLRDNEIDFLTIDTEGFELQVLQSNDWQKYRPKVICLEKSQNKKEEKEILEFLNKRNYKLFVATKINLIFKTIL
jgi:FkbM family methyltransferase